MKNILLKLIRFYQKSQPYHLKVLERLFMTESTCRFSPTCSQYTFDAVKKYGALKGILLGFRRIIRCHPWNKGGFDPLK